MFSHLERTKVTRFRA